MENQQQQEIGESSRATGADILRRNDYHSDVGEREEEEVEDEEMEKLEEEVTEMGEKLKKYRSSLPVQLKSTLSSVLASQRPLLSLSSDEPGPSGGSNRGDSSGVLPADDDGKTVDEVELLRDKISSNISAMPGVLKRMKDCISRIEKLVSSNETIHPAFQRKKR